MSELGSLPEHIAIIMDGNGRWARKRNLPRTHGHREAAESVRSVVEECTRLGVKLLTLYAFSTENWNRPKYEVNYLMRLLERFLVREEEVLMKNNIALEAIGRIGGLSKGVQEKLEHTIKRTGHNTGLRVCLALNYGGRAEIVDAAKKLAAEMQQGRLSPEGIDEELFRHYLYTDSNGEPFPEPDLLIRTAGEMRISNFLLWQASYAELYVTDVCWPDFRACHLKKAIEEYGRRVRKFGALKDNNDGGKNFDGPRADRALYRGNGSRHTGGHAGAGTADRDVSGGGGRL